MISLRVLRPLARILHNNYKVKCHHGQLRAVGVPRMLVGYVRGSRKRGESFTESPGQMGSEEDLPFRGRQHGASNSAFICPIFWNACNPTQETLYPLFFKGPPRVGQKRSKSWASIDSMRRSCQEWTMGVTRCWIARRMGHTLQRSPHPRNRRLCFFPLFWGGALPLLRRRCLARKKRCVCLERKPNRTRVKTSAPRPYRDCNISSERGHNHSSHRSGTPHHL